MSIQLASGPDSHVMKRESTLQGNNCFPCLRRPVSGLETWREIRLYGASDGLFS